MKIIRFAYAAPLMIALASPYAAADPAPGQYIPGWADDPSRFMKQPADTAPRPKADPKRIINESSSFLKEREPEMSEEEYALYEKVVTMLSTNPEFALKLLEGMMVENQKPSPAFDFILGNAYYGANQYDKAEAKFRSAVERYPTFLRAWVNLGLLYFSTERYVEAVPCFSKAIVLGDRDSTTFGMLGFSLEKQGNIVAAEMAYMQALSGDPSNVDWEEGLLRICVEGKQYGRAESLVKYLIRQQPTDTRFWLIYANILLSDNRKLEATVLLETAAGMGVASTDELSLLGDLYADQDLVPEAVAIYGKVLVPSPELGERKLIHLARVLISDGKPKEAERVLAMVDSNPTADGRMSILQAKADLYAAEKRWSDEHRELDALLALAPLNGKALLSLGRVYNAEDDIPRATFAFEAAYRVPATTYTASLELANIELKSRHYSKSAEYLEKALSIEKSDAIEDFLARVKTLIVKED
jgi:tetratricopeptide (TPR) repeat protein